MTLFLSPGARSLLWGYKRNGEIWGVQEVRSDSSQRDRERWEPRYVLSVRACARDLNLVVLLLCTSELDRSNQSTSLLEESASPFIDEEDGLISERERVRMLLNLAAHAGGDCIVLLACRLGIWASP